MKFAPPLLQQLLAAPKAALWADPAQPVVGPDVVSYGAVANHGDAFVSSSL